MRSLLIAATIAASPYTTAQYGSFDRQAIAAAKSTTTLVVLDDGDSPYNRAMMDAMKAHWTFTATHDYIHAHDLATQPLAPDKIYLLRTLKSDQEKHDGHFLTLVQGWKQKKGETLSTTNGSFSSIPADKELAFLLIDPQRLADHQATAMYGVYVKHLQDYLKQVEAGKITDKATADRMYQGRNRLVRDENKLLIATDHLDKSLPDPAAVKANYTHDVDLVDLAAVINAVQQQDHGIAVSDVVLTGDHKTRWCFKRVFNAGTGELMYQRDEAALYGKKEGFLDEDFKQIERAR